MRLQHRKDGRWHAAIQQNGHRRYIYAKTRRELEAKLRDDEPAPRPGGLALGVFLGSWLADVLPSLRPTTQLSYRMTVEKHLVAALGDIPLAALSVDDVQGYVNASSLAPGTIRRHVTVLHRALRAAQSRGLVAGNVASFVEIPSGARTERRVLSASEVRTFLDGLRGDRLYPLWLLAATMGLRRGELLGLRWGDVDTKRRTLTVARTLIRLDGQFYFGEPKSDNSRRTVALPAFVASALAQYRAGAPDDALVFRRPNGEPIYGHRLTEQMKAATGLRFHDLRHSAATNLLAMGASLEDVKRLLGHSTIATTSDQYGHLDLGRQREVAERLGRLYGVKVVSSGPS